MGHEPNIYALFTRVALTFMRRLCQISYTISIDMPDGSAGLFLDRSMIYTKL